MIIDLDFTLPTVLQVGMLLGKVLGFIEISWFWVFTPVWLTLVIVAIMALWGIIQLTK